MVPTYAISFSANGGHGVSKTVVWASQTVVRESSGALNANTFVKDGGYDFVRWNTAKDGKGNTNYSDGKVITFTSDLTL